MKAPRLAATLAVAAFVCGAGGLAPAHANEVMLFPYPSKCPAGWSARQPGPIDGLTWCSGSHAGGGAFVGELRLLAASYCPAEWAVADGKLLPIVQAIDLYEQIGTSFGGNGTSLVQLPDLSDKPAGTIWCMALTGRAPKR
jgi:hypothetical protein